MTQSGTLSIGTSSAGAGNRAMRLSSGMTYTPGSQITVFSSTSATAQTITTAGKVMGAVQFNGVGSSYQLADSYTNASTSTNFTIFRGTIDTNGQTVNIGRMDLNGTNTKVLTLGASAVSVDSWSANATGTTINSGTSAITVTGSGTTFGGSNTYYDMTFTQGVTLSGSNSFRNLTVNGSASKTNAMNLGGSQTCSSTLAINGNSSTNRLFVNSSTIGTAQTLTAATVSVTNADFRDITGAGAGSWNLSAITGSSGDCGGNSGITFTSNATQTFQGTASGSWSDVSKWTSRVPLPQDDVLVNASFISGRTVTADMPRLGKSVSFSGTSNTPSFSISISTSIFGSLNLSSVGSLSGNLVTFEGRSNYTLTSNGKSFGNGIAISAPGGKITCQDALSSSVTLNFGELDTAGYTWTAGSFSSSNSNTRAITIDNSTVTTTGTGLAWNTATTTGLTVSATGSTLIVNNITETAKTVALGGKTYNNITITGDKVTISGAGNVINALAINNAGYPNGLKLQSGQTQNISNITTNGSAGNLAILLATTSGTPATISKTSGVIALDYMSIQDITATGGASFYAGSHSTDVSGNSGWSFSDPVSGTANGDSSASGVGQSAIRTVGAAVADSTCSAIGRSLVRSVATAAGIAVAAAVAISGFASTATAAGDSTCVGVGQSTIRAVGTASGDSSATGIGQSFFRSVGSSTGDSTCSGVGQSIFNSIGISDGLSTCSGIGKSLAYSAGTSDGLSTCIGVADSNTSISAVGSAVGSSACDGVSGSLASSVGSSDGLSVANATGAATAHSVGSSDGISTCDGVGQSINQTTGQALGDSVADATGQSYMSTVGDGQGSSTCDGIGSSLCFAVGSADASSSCTGVTEATGEGVGQADGSSSCIGVGSSLCSAVGTADASSTCQGYAEADGAASGSCDGDSTCSGVGQSLCFAIGIADGQSTCIGEGSYDQSGSTGLADGNSTCIGVGSSLCSAVGSADGNSTCNGAAGQPPITQSGCHCNVITEYSSGGIKFGGVNVPVTNTPSGGIKFGGTNEPVLTNDIWHNFSNVYPLSESGLGVTGEYVDVVQANNGTGGDHVLDSVPTITDGVFCQPANRFDGNDFININKDKLNEFQPITVSAWVKIESFGQTRTIYSRGFDSESSSWILQLGHNYANQITASVQTIDSVGATTVTTVLGTTYLQQNINYHFAVVYNPGSSLVVYVNGVLAGSRAVTDTTTIANNSGNYIGRFNLKANPVGSIQEVRVSGVARSAAWLLAEKNNFCGNFYQIGEEESAIIE